MNSAVIVAAGQGTRMGGPVDKLFIEIAGLPVVGHAWKRMDAAPGIDEVVLVIRAGGRGAFDTLASKLDLTKPHRFVEGGAERQESVWNGIESLPDEAVLVAVHDGARPCTSLALITEVLAAANEHGAAVAAQRVVDTIKQSHDGVTVSRHLDRSRLWAVQTPQCFQVPVIRRALQAVREQRLQITDDTAACELIGQPVRLVEGRSPNPKLTGPEDVMPLEALLRTDLLSGG